VVRPVAGRREEYEEEKGAVDAGSVEEVGADEEEKDEDRRGVCRDEEERQPTADNMSVSGCCMADQGCMKETNLRRQNMAWKRSYSGIGGRDIGRLCTHPMSAPQ